MAKTESPPFKMLIEKGHLVPAAAWDAERLATYRNGSTVSVHITQDKNRKLERKYWAILGEVIKSCPVKQRTKEDLHKAIRLKLGVVDAYFTLEGRLRVDVKSTSGMEEPEYREFFEEAMTELHKLTGVDPLTLHEESPDVGEDEPDRPEIDAPPGETIRSTEDATMDAEPMTGQSPVGSASPEPAQAAEPEAGAPEAEDVPAAGPASGVDEREMVNSGKPMATDFLKAEMVKKVLDMAGDQRLSEKERLENLAAIRPAWVDQMPGHPTLVDQVFKTAAKVIKGELPKAKAHQYLETL